MDYNEIVQHYENCFEKYGDTHKGLDWPNEKDMFKRYDVMLDLIRWKESSLSNISVMDFGCGTGKLLSYISEMTNFTDFSYTGVDASMKFIIYCKEKFPNNVFFHGDILKTNFQMPSCDWIIANGVFTEKRTLTEKEMWKYFTKVISKLYNCCGKGIAFNVISDIVDWKREDLFHLSHDKLCKYLISDLSRNYIIRNDYGLYEYTVYIYKI
jgi:SAM-dependent methyltransferase